MIKKGTKVRLNDKYMDWEKFREEKTVLTVSSIGKIGDKEVAWFEEVSNNPDCLYGGCYALDGLEKVED